jgi:thiol-disulfide isomerase/thioredoxin
MGLPRQIARLPKGPFHKGVPMSRTRVAERTRPAAERVCPAVLVALMCCCGTSAYGQSTSPAYRKAFEEASATGKPLLLLVGADWCHHCVVVKEELLPKLKKSGLLDRVAFAYVDYDRDSRLAGQVMSGRFIPELILFQKSHDGWKVSRLSGGTSLGQLEEFVKSGLRKSIMVATAP